MLDARVLELFWIKAEVGAATVSSNGTFTRANDKFCEIVEYTSAELVGKRFQEITLPGDTKADEVMAFRLEKGEIDHYKMVKTYIKKSGYPVLIELIVWPLRNPDGTFELFLAQIIPYVNVKASSSKEVHVDPASVVSNLLSRHKGIITKLVTAIVAIITALAFAITELVKALAQ